MPKYAGFDVFTPRPAPVIGWYDTDSYTYPGFSLTGKIQVTEDQWTARLVGLWAVDDSDLVVPYTEPVIPPSLGQQAQMMLAAGCQIASTGTPAINATYACTDAARITLAEACVAIAAGGFPGGAGTYHYLDVAGVSYTFPSTTVFLAFAVAMRNFIYACNEVSAGNSGTLPTLPVTIA